MDREKNYPTKRYPHFDKALPYKFVESYVTNPVKISKHSFFPLLYYKKDLSKYKWLPSEYRKGLKRKYREIMYAGHIDGYIYKYYGENLNYRYDQYISERGFEACVTAYRSPKSSKAGQCNIDFAKEVFDFIVEQKEAYIIVGDFKNFFPELCHQNLKEKIWKVLGKHIPNDWYSVFRSVTQYCYIKRAAVQKYYDTTTKQYFLDKKEFRDFKRKIKEESLKNISDPLFFVNKSGKGIPQGTAISGVLANIYMIDMDEEISLLASRYSGLYRRYSDDFILVIPIKDDLGVNINDFMELIKMICKDKVVLSDEKTHVYHYRDSHFYPSDKECCCSIDYLGFLFDGDSVLVRQKCIYKFARTSRQMIESACQMTRRQRVPYLKFKGSLLRYITETPYRKKKNKRKRVSNFVTYAIRAEQMLSKGSRYQVKVLSQIQYLRKNVQHSYDLTVHAIKGRQS